MLPADIVPVIEGQVYYPAARRLSYGGKDVTEYLLRLLQQQEDTAFREAPTSELHRLKEECIRIAESKEAALSEGKGRGGSFLGFFWGAVAGVCGGISLCLLRALGRGGEHPL